MYKITQEMCLKFLPDAFMYSLRGECVLPITTIVKYPVLLSSWATDLCGAQSFKGSVISLFIGLVGSLGSTTEITRVDVCGGAISMTSMIWDL